MAARDWILLAIPILANGVLVFIIQSYFKYRLEKNKANYERRRMIKDTYFQYLLAVKNSYKQLAYAAHGSEFEKEKFIASYNMYADNIRELNDYYNTYKVVLANFKSNAENLCSIFDSFSSTTKLKWSETTRNTLVSLINKMYELICSICDLYLAEI